MWPCFIIVLARNWPKVPNPTMPILRLWELELDDDMVEKNQIMMWPLLLLPRKEKKTIQQYYEDLRGEGYLLLMDAAIYAMRTTHFLTRVEATTPFQFLLSLVVN